MKTYKTIDTVRLFSGIIGLDDVQAGARMHRLEKKEDGVFDILDEVCFKAGEIIRLPNVDKSTIPLLEVVEDKKAMAASEPSTKISMPKAKQAVKKKDVSKNTDGK